VPLFAETGLSIPPKHVMTEQQMLLDATPLAMEMLQDGIVHKEILQPPLPAATVETGRSLGLKLAMIHQITSTDATPLVQVMPLDGVVQEGLHY